MKTPPSAALDRYIVRLPDGMRDELKAAAKANGRSMNAEIVARLQGDGDARALRDDFAGRAMQGMVSTGKPISIHDGLFHREAAVAYAIADAMLKARDA